MRRSTLWTSGGIAALLATGAFAGITVDFETDDSGAAIGNGQIIDTEFSTFFTLTSAGPNAGLAAFDTTTGVNAADPDLWFDIGNALILQNDGNAANDGSFFFDPDDDLDGGTISFAFVNPSIMSSIDIMDINGNGFASVTLTDSAGLTRVYEIPDDWTGDILDGAPGIGTLDLTTLADQAGFAAPATASEDAGFNANAVVTMDVFFSGSAALDNFVFQIPVPGALALFALGLANPRRRRTA